MNKVYNIGLINNKMKKSVNIIIILVILAIVISFIYMQSENKLDFESCDPFQESYEYEVKSYYNGPLFDAHLHLTGQDSEGRCTF